MTPSLPTLYVLALVVVLSACATKPPVTTRELPPGTPPLDQRIDLGVPRGSITFRGRIMSVSAARSADSTDVCATAPCMARVQVLGVSMVGYGGPTRIMDGDEVQVMFPMTLLPTEWDGVTVPGLQVGSTFQGMAFELATMDGNILRMTSYSTP